MQALLVIYLLQETANTLLCLAFALIFGEINFFALEGLNKALCLNVVIGVGLATH